MKRFILNLFVLILVTCSLDSYSAGNEGEFYVGYAQIPINVSGLVDAQLSDWKTWGTSDDSRVFLPLSDGNRDGLGQGLTMGFQSKTFIPLLLECQIFPATGLISNLVLGFKINVINTRIFKFAISPKVGGSLFYQNLGTLTELNNEYDYVDLDGYIGETNNDPRVGDQISAQMIGLVNQISADLQLNLTKHIGFLFTAGISESRYADLQLSIDRNGVPLKIHYNDSAIVENDNNSIESANLDPKITSDGHYYSGSLIIAF